MTPCGDKWEGQIARTSLETLLRHFRAHRSRAQDELDFYANQPCLAKAIEAAALCKRPDGKRHSHQRRIPGVVLDDAMTDLLEVEADLRDCKNFEALYELVAGVIEEIPGIGPLTLYDITHRLAMFLQLEPDQVYLHAGTRKGARALGLGDGEEAVPVSEFPEPIRSLKAWEIEDFLCTYKDHLWEIRLKARGRLKRGCRD